MMQEHSESPPNSVCAVVVAYFPDGGFEQRIQALLPQVETLIVVDNTPDESNSARLDVLKKSSSAIHIIENRENVGVAAALNQGLDFALVSGHKWLLTLDQDTQCYPEMVAALLQICAACDFRPAAIGSNYLDTQNGRLKVETGDDGGYLEQTTVITSGCLVDANLAHSIGGFRGDYFIDQVDHEFCLRARSHGYRVLISRKPLMAHSVGGPGGVWIPFLGTLPNHPPLRKYYIARNTIATILAYWRQEPGWCLRRLTRLLLGLILMATLEEQRLAKVRAFIAGIQSSLHKRMGAYSRDD